eukprot:Platyproteum_vivax@DN8910_c0_g1_i1.p1
MSDPHACECKTFFSTIVEARQHAALCRHLLMRKKHNWDYTCHKCNKTLSSLPLLNKHFESANHKEIVGSAIKKVLWCSECGKFFKLEQGAANHLWKWKKDGRAHNIVLKDDEVPNMVMSRSAVNGAKKTFPSK